jgi:hypothetical protein
MTLTVLLLSGIVIAFSSAYVVTTRAYGMVAEPALAGETTVVGLADPAAETLGNHSESSGSMECDWHMTTLSALCDAEELLDALEAQGYEERELVILGNSCFAVRWK